MSAFRPSLDVLRDMRIRSLTQNGWSYGQIAAVLNTTRGVIAGVLHRDREATAGQAAQR